MQLSVVVTIVDAREALTRCLSALAAQDNPPEMEVLVPWDDSVAGIAEVVATFPAFRFLAMGAVLTVRPAASAAGQHELFDRRRSVGLAAASGDVIAILEDRGVPRADWARRMVAIHERLPYAVIGGAIQNGVDRVVQWAVFLCDFNRYEPPFEAGPREYVSDVNIGYKRRVIAATASLWRDRYHETTVHWALQRSGEVLYLSPELVVSQHRDGLRLAALAAERFAWGRLFAYTRARELPGHRRLALGLLAPLLPLVLLHRHLRLQLAKKAPLRRMLMAAPVMLVLLLSWSLGEAAGYATGRA